MRRPNSRQDEFEADQRGLRTLKRAGYAPSAMIAFMEKLLNQRSLPSFLSTHPATSDVSRQAASLRDATRTRLRIAALKRQIARQPTNSSGGLNNAAYEAKIQPLS